MAGFVVLQNSLISAALTGHAAPTRLSLSTTHAPPFGEFLRTITEKQNGLVCRNYE
jgi:hypothetical protein